MFRFRSLSWCILVALVLAVALLSGTVAQPQQDQQQQESTTVDDNNNTTTQQQQQQQQMLNEASPDITASFIFPKYGSTRVVAGEPVEALISFINTGENPFTITGIAGSLRHPLDFRYIIQNYSLSEFSVSIAPHEEISMSYLFHPWELEARDYYFQGDVFYQDHEDRLFYMTWYNGTVTLLEPPPSIETRTFFTICAVLVGLTLLGYFGSRSYFSRKTQQEKQARKERGTRSDPAADNEWLVGTAAENFGKQKKAKGRRQ